MKSSLKFLSLILFVSCVGTGIEPLQELHFFVMERNIKKVKSLLDEGEDIHLVNNGRTVLNLASREGDAKMVSFLISRGGRPQ